MREDEDLIRVEDTLWVLSRRVGLPVYDFDFSRYFTCRRPWQRPDTITAVARAGAYENYNQRQAELAAEGIALIHSPDEHARASELPCWYPLLEDLTPRSVWFDRVPDVREVTAAFQWPVFVKGQRQTSRHRRSLSIIDGPEAFDRAMATFRQDPILGWQKIVCREYLRLRPVEDTAPDRIPTSFEFRTFWWRGELVGLGRYWWEGKSYAPSEDERGAAVGIAGEAAKRVNVAFLVVDVAQTEAGRWVVIECNDGQESGYAGVPPFALWQAVLAIENR
jgi:hypothetical protein